MLHQFFHSVLSAAGVGVHPKPIFQVFLILVGLGGWNHSWTPPAVRAQMIPESASVPAGDRAASPQENRAETPTPRFRDGVYLYGQSAEPEQLGQAYMVFEVNQERLVGAFYMPRSSFDCFTGRSRGNHLALNIVDSYSQETHAYSINYDRASILAAQQGGADLEVGLEGFYVIEPLGETDHRILAVCKSDFDEI
ncbi:MAG: hypothetical protein ACP5D7_20705 [Limnospira sp.]